MSEDPTIVDIYPLSPMQQGMLFHTLYSPDSAVYFEQFSCVLRGTLDVAAFALAWRQVALRHSILRTAFVWEGVQEPHQVVLDRVDLPVERLDWRDADPVLQKRRLDAYLAEDRRRGFDLQEPPLMRLTLIRVEEDAWRFIWRFHHLLLDGWSGNLLLGEVFALYAGLCHGRLPELPPVPPFRDYIAWLARQDMGRAEAFWRETLSGFESPTPLVVDHPADPNADAEAGEATYTRCHARLGAAFSSSLTQFARRHKLTLNTLFQGAWVLLLSRYSRERDVVFGATSSGRPAELPGVESMLGVFVNTLPARVSVPPAAPLLPWLGKLQTAQARLREFEYSPLAQVQGWSELGPGAPLFESIQGVENYPVSRWAGQPIEGLVLEDLEAFERTNYPLTVLATPGAEMGLEIWYETGRFDRPTVERMVRHLESLLADLTTEAPAGREHRLDELSLLAPEERRELLALDAATRRTGVEKGVRQLFEEQVAERPDAVALLSGTEAVSYRRLDQAADRLARDLHRLGIGPERLVAVSSESPLLMVVGILGILKSGAGYLPLDPSHPQERLAAILSQAGVGAAVADAGLLDRLVPTARCLSPAAALAAPEEGDDGPPPLALGEHGDRVAYAIFTSGSTGQPKGILVSESALLALTRSFVEVLGLRPGERLLMIPALTFDASVGNLFPALLSGATLVVHPRPGELGGEELLDLCARLSVTLLDIPAAFWSAWAEWLSATGGGEGLAGLRLVIAGGESLSFARIERWAAATGRRVVLFGPYGPTEATVCTTSYKTIDGGELPPLAARLPIGRALPHARVLALDPAGEPAPLKVPGEIFIGGAALARGYLGRPDLTAERFVPDPWPAAPGDRLYRTGDLARRLPDRNLEFAGRVDGQVKVRGYRIEPAEIEAVLLRHPEVAEAAVIAREDAPGDRRLAAYVVPRREIAGGGEQEIEEWQQLFDGNYADSVAARPTDLGAALDCFDGWTSSATGEPIPLLEMREWAEHTARRVLRLAPKRVLEIGCGTGLLLLRLAPHCESYLGTDFSAEALAYLERVLASGPALPEVELRHRPADDWTGIAAGSFDVVILNSVAQYFPGLDYFLDVLRGAVEAVSPGGAVFLGDLRSLPLLPAFHAGIELERALLADPSMSRVELARRAARRLAVERELAIDPALFSSLRRELPKISRVEVELKRGRGRNELTRYRYDVTLHVGSEPVSEALAEEDRLAWPASGLDREEIAHALAAPDRPALRLTGIPNPRVEEPLRLTALLAEPEGPATAGGIATAAAAARTAAPDPEDLHELGAELGWEVETGFACVAGIGEPGLYEARFRRPGARPATDLAPEPAAGRSFADYANAPARDAEVQSLPARLRAFLRSRLPEYMVPPAILTLDALPVTANGKLDRRALPAPGVEPRAAEGRRAPRTPAEEALAAIWMEVLGLPEVGFDENFFELGGDSILSIQIVSRAAQAGLKLTPKQIFEHQTIAALAAAAKSTETPVAAAAEGESLPTEPVAVPLTPIESWFFERPGPAPHHWNQALLFEIHDPRIAAAVPAAVRRLVVRHDALRLRFSAVERGVQQVCLPASGESPAVVLDLGALPAARQTAEIERQSAALQASLDLARGPLLRVARFDLGSGVPPRLLIAAHHLAVDGVSWSILLADLAALAQASALPPPPTSFRAWAEHLAARARAPELERELPYWLEGSQGNRPLPLDFPLAENREGSAQVVSVFLDAPETRALLSGATAAFGARFNELLVGALAHALARWTGPGARRIDLESHGRETDAFDLSRTVGWFTVSYPALVSADPAAPSELALPAAARQLREIPGDGSGYGLLRYLSPSPAARALARLPAAQVNFNYLGQIDAALLGDSPWRPAGEPIGPSRSPRGPRRHLLEINAFVTQGRLRCDWSFNRELHRRETIERLAASFRESLGSLAHRLLTGEPPALTAPAVLLPYPAPGPNVEDVHPLSPMQEGMLFHALYAPGTGIYFQQFACTLEGALDAPAFHRAWDAVFAQHTALRTSFLAREGEAALAVVSREVALPWRELDWSALLPAEQRERFAALAAEDRGRDFDLGAAPLSRLYLARTGEARHRLLWSHHHLLLDGWCLPRVLGQVLAGYESFRRGEEPSFPPARPYRLYIDWLERQDRGAAEGFWRALLAGLTAPTPLGLDRPLAGGQGAPGALVRATLPAPQNERLRAFARRQHLTLSTLVQGAWALLLAVHGGSRDVVFGTAVSGRPAELPGVEEMIGLFINTLPVRAETAPSRPLLDWLREIQALNLDLRQYEFSPLVEVQGASDVPRGEPLFESLVVFENYPVDPGLGSGGSLQLAEIETFEHTHYPLELLAIPGQTLELALTYDGTRLDGAAVRRFAGHLVAVLAAFPAEGAERLEDLSWLAAAERHQLLAEWNDGLTAGWIARPPALLHEAIAARAAENPQAVALISEDRRLDYGQLAAQTARLARRLRRLGLPPETRVAVFCSRSPELIVALLGVFEAGLACLPLDPSIPAARIATLIVDSEAAIALCDAPFTERAAALGLPLFQVESEEEETPAEAALPSAPVHAEQLAYVLYTSGTTASPKGVGLSHRAFANYFRAMVAEYGVTAADRFLQIGSAAFDVSAEEIYTCLWSGATLVLRPHATVGAVDQILADCRRHEITVLDLPTALWHEVVLALDQDDAEPLSPSIRLVILGGEEARIEKLAAWQRRTSPAVRVVNTYGPTETTIVATLWWTESPPPPRLPIGRPIADIRAYGVDAAFRAVPVGAPGELLLGGPGLARGYLKRAELTAASFVPDPFGAPGERLYRTGDRVRWAADGNLEFLGRLDRQIKVRGHRVELGEIEAVLASHPAVRQAAVLARTEPGGSRRVVAYLEVDDPAALRPEAVRDYVGARLPAAMVPAQVVVRAELPRHISGKVDRRALHEIPLEAEPGPVAAPRGAVEELLAGLFAELIGVPRVGSDDSFFALGGHSLLATRLASRVRSALGVELPLPILFERPTVAALAAWVEATRGEAPAALPPLVHVDRTQPLPLSYAQQRLWFLDRLEPGNPTYNLPTFLALRGELSLPALSAALSAVAARHEVLRTVLVETTEGPIQSIRPPAPVPLPLVDLRGLDPGRREEEARHLAAREARRPFDLAAEPLRSLLARIGEDEHLWLLDLHHVAADGWSIGVLLRELALLYSAHLEDQPSPLPELAFQYADYAVWQRRWLQGEALAAQLDFWRHRLAGAPPLLELPTDRPRPAAASWRGAIRLFALAQEESEALRRLARREGVTLFMALTAGLQAALGRSANQDEVVVGTPVANRRTVDLEALIGCFVNTLALRGSLSPGRSWREQLRQTREEMLAAYAHQDLPFERLVEELNPERQLAASPLFQAMLALDPEAEPAEFSGIEVLPFVVERGVSRFDLNLSLRDDGGTIAGLLEYATDLFDATTVDRFLARYRTLLGAAAAAPERRLADLAWFGEAELHQIRREWNDTAGPAWESGGTLHGPIERQALLTPDAIAVSSEEGAWTYGELLARSSRLARRLRELGVGPEVRVGICMERSLELMAALVATLQAGGAYVPLDPSYPPERLAWMLEDAAPAVVLTQERLLSLLPAWPGAVLAVDREWPSLPSPPLISPVSPSNLAYAIFTSGSTGRPKGAMNSHAGIANRLGWMQETYGLGAGDRVLQKTPISFDVSVWELFWPLWMGATLVMARPGGHREPRYLADTLEREGITTIHFVPSLLRAFLDEGGGSWATLQRVICSGEALPGPLAMEALEQFAGDLDNLYGPTEAAVDVTRWACRKAPLDAGVPIGRPIANTSIHLLDRDLRPVPLGVVGELYIGGVAVGRGYLGRGGLTAERFVPDPLSTEPGARLYRTGDLARHEHGGEIYYLGRADHQVKLRGQRIELGEIESALLTCLGVREAAVVLRELAPGDMGLVAYWSASDEGPARSTADLRAELSSRLPSHMLPGAFVQLPSLPLSPSGKVDRRALPAPQRERAAAETALRSPLSELVAGIWAEVLGLDSVGEDEDFFALGGHSLLAAQVVARLRATLGAEVRLRELFEAPTVAGLAAAVERARSSERRLQAPPLVPIARTGDLPLSFAQQRMWFLARLEPEASAYNMPLAIDLAGELSVSALAHALVEIERRHEVLRTRFALREGLPLLVIERPRLPFLPVADLRSLGTEVRAAELARLSAEESARPFDLARGPVLRTFLLRAEPERSLLLATFHHIASDGWSERIFLRELGVLYEAFQRGEASPLPELPVQYVDYAAWERSWFTGEVLAEQVGFWRDHLAGAPAVLELPTDRPRPAVVSERGASCKVALSPELSQGLRALGRHSGATPFMVLLAGYAALLGRHAGQEDVVVGTPVAGRRLLATENLIGLFINTLALRCRWSGGSSFASLLGKAREAVLDGHQHQDLPFERLVEELTPQRSLSYSPIFQAFLGMEAGAASAGSLSERSATSSVKYDLMLGLGERAAGFAGELAYRVDLFDPSTIQRIASRLVHFLESAVAQPEAPISDLTWFGKDETHQLTREWNDTAGPVWEGGGTLHGPIERQALLTPDAIAVAAEEGVWTYGELASRSSRLAGRLLELGVGPEVRVGICMERSLELMAALVATLQAGGAYVPLDPSYPPERLSWMLEDAAPAVVLTQERLLPLLPAWPGAVLVVDREWPALSRRPSSPLDLPVSPSSLAYVIFTSGSTGRPKGAMNSHAGIANRLGWMQEAYGLDATDRVLQKTPISFDVSVWELFWPLWMGATLVMARPGGHRETRYLAETIEREGITTLHFVPSLLRAFLDEDGGSWATPRRVILSGEALPGPLAEETLARFSGELENLYGPTEAAVDVTRWACRNAPLEAGVPIGRPIANTSIHLLDRDLRPVPLGVVGELYIGGVAVGRGYLGRGDLTAERFLPDPLSSEPGARLYRTGDLARHGRGGEVFYLGRADQQVKLRGQRIEPGEIEAALLACPGVREAAVVLRELAPGDLGLVAYWSASEEGPSRSTAELRSDLSSRLPSHMLPGAFVQLPSLPLGPSGKVDRRALPAPTRERPIAETAPRSPLSELIAGIWAEVLGLQAVGEDEDFFALGGHSLLATQVVARLRATLGVEIKVRELFEAPTVAGLAAAVERERISERRTDAPPLVPIAREGDLPLSFAQQRMWFLSRLEPEASAYIMPMAIDLAGDLDVAALARAIGEVERRHEVLRTRFAVREGLPVPVVSPPRRPFLPVVDLRGLGAQARSAELHRQTAAEAGRPFDLVRGPVLRTLLLRHEPERSVLFATFHHIASDGWSERIFLRELGALYPAFHRGEPSPLPDLPVQYADYAAWERGWFAGEVLARQVGYWRDHLAGAPAVLELPTDRPRPAVVSERGASCPVALPPELSQGLLRLGRRLGATPFMILLAGYAALLGRLSGQEDVVVGTPIAGRRLLATENLIGLFVNTLALRCRLPGASSFAALLGQVRNAVLDGHQHQDLPFERLVEELQPQRSLSYSPIFQAFLGMEAGAASTGSPAEGTATPSVKFDLMLGLGERESRFAGELAYRTDLFDPSTARRIVSRLARLLESAVASPESPLADLTWFDEAESHQVSQEWNDTAAPVWQEEGTLHGPIERQAERTPDAIAVASEEGLLTYGELAARSARLARRLRELGVGPEVRVGICMERSLDLMAALLATLQAGGAYVPLDPGYPPERLASMLEDAAPAVVLTQERLLPVLAPGTGAATGAVLAVDREWPALSGLSSSPLDLPVSPRNLAYVIFTSGSTGRPKGAMNSHAAIANRLGWAQQVYALQPADRLLQKTPISFDVSVWELFWPLWVGATLVLSRPGGHREPRYLAERIERERITTIQFVPSLLRAFVDEGAAAAWQPLRRVICSGEALPAPLVEETLARFSGELDNLYGPTEAAVEVTRWACRSASLDVGIPIGRPIANVSLHLLDRDLRPVPLGVAGELYIGGLAVGRGYLGRGDLTAERFVPDPFSATPGGRLYRTGDLARHGRGGEIFYLGRADQQVKLRGQRIELGEIEAALLASPGVREAAVVLRELAPGDLGLVAYWSPAADTPPPSASDLRSALSSRLPAHMLPGSFVTLPSLPLTPSGKVDRRALPAPESLRGPVRIPPRDLWELALCEIWEEVLGVSPVGVTESFFELGGHSLLALRLLSLVRRRTGRDLPLPELLAHPTVEHLAQALRSTAPASSGPLVALRPAGEERPLFLVHPIGGDVFCYFDLVRHLPPGLPVHALRSPALDGGEPSTETAATVEALAHRYLAALRAVQPAGPYQLGGWSFGGGVAFEMARQLEQRGERAEIVLLLDSAPPAPAPMEGDAADQLTWFALDFAAQLGLDLRLEPEDLRGLSPEEQWHLLAERGRLSGLPEASLDLDRLRRLFEVARAHLAAWHLYAGGPLASPLLLLRSQATGEEAAAGWAALAAGRFASETLPGDHYTLLRGQVGQLAACLIDALTPAGSEPEAPLVSSAPRKETTTDA